MIRNNKVWIAWEDDGSIRSRILAKELNAKFCTFTLFESIRGLAPLRYFIAILQTFLTIAKQKTKILVVQNPSVFLSFFSALIKPLFKYALVIDLHTLCINPEGIKKAVRDFVSDYSLKRGNIIIVTNRPYKDKIKEKTSREIFVLPDKIPDFDSPFKKVPLKGKYNILFICSFSADEPWQDVINASELVNDDVYIYISGKNRLNPEDMPSNVILTGFLPNEEYQNLLGSVDIIMVLTDKEDCMVCGAYEAVAAEKPLILSDKIVLREYFDRGTVFTKNNRDSIARAIVDAINDRENLKEDIKNLKKRRTIEWKESWNYLSKKLSDVAPNN